MEQKPEFDDIRPLYDEEVPGIIDELLRDPEFKRVVFFLLPDTDWEAFESQMRSFKTKKEFQYGIVSQTVKYIAGKTATSLDLGGVENIDKGKAYSYLSNHRDIVMDASALCILLADAGADTTEIAIGDNLLIHPWIEKFVRLNKSFIVRRGVSMRQMLEVSGKLSRYIHYTINEKNQSIWMAQREGRSKDSNDNTQESLLKMLSMGGGDNFMESIRKVNIAPLSISYEYDPCDYLKAKEFQLKRDNPEHKKSPLDDLLNMETGLFGFKGNIHFQIGHPINGLIDPSVERFEKQEQVSAIAALIDKEIHLNYRFYPINYIAFDRLEEKKRFEDKYTPADEASFDKYLQERLDKINLDNKDIPFLTDRLLEMYANPVRNYLKAKG